MSAYKIVFKCVPGIWFCLTPPIAIHWRKMNVVANFGNYPLEGQVRRLAIMLNCEDDRNVCLILRKMLRNLALPVVAAIYEQATMDVLFG